MDTISVRYVAIAVQHLGSPERGGCRGAHEYTYDGSPGRADSDDLGRDITFGGHAGR
jgi:hypothetical protein